MIIGIDPDLVKNGVAIVENGKLMDLSAKSMVELIKFIAVVQKHEPKLTVVLEDVEAIKPTFKRKGVNAAGKLKIAQNVGQVKATARHLKAFFDDMGVNTVMVKPLRGTVKLAKSNAVVFNNITGWKGTSSEDKRDAALLAMFGGVKDEA